METNEKSKTSKMVRRTMMTVMICLMGIMTAFAQPGFKTTAEGTIVDSKTQEPLFAATVKVTSADGGTGTFGITDSIGHFTFEVDRPGKYTLEFSYVGYKPLTKEVNIWPGRGAKLGTFKMDEDATYLKEVESVARNQRVKQKGDTIVYNADAYKVQDGATAEDLVKKMPGIEVTDEGVKAQGETVEKVLVDGKSFFENDPKLALKTLPAEVVQSVSVFDKKSDQAEFTGFDDGNTVKAMDLTTKSYRRNGVFGKVYGSIGDNFDLDNLYWNAGFNLNVFSGNRRVSLLGMSNNVNQQNFTFDDLQSAGGGFGGFGGRMMMRMGGQSGVSRANAFGLNFNDSYLDDKLEIQGSYFFNQLRTVNDNETQTDNHPILTDTLNNIYRYQSGISTSNSLSHNYSHSFNMRIMYKPSDNDQFIFRPSVSLQKSDANSFSNNDQWMSPLDSILALTDLQRADRTQMYNYSRTLSQSDNESWNVNGMLTWRHRFGKSGRTLSSEVRGQYSGNNSTSNNIRLGSMIRLGETFRNSDSEQKNWSAGGNLQYTEPIGQLGQLSVRYNVNYQQSDRESNVGYDAFGNSPIDYNYTQFHTGMDSLDSRNSSSYLQKNLRQGGELGIRLRTETINLMGGINFETSHLTGEQDYFAWEDKYGKNPSFNTTRDYFSILPNMRFEWSPVQGTSVNIDYRARTSNPSIQNLQEIINTSNPMRYSTGNKDLDQTTSHNVGLRFIHSNMETATNIMLFTNYSFSNGNIGNEVITNYSNRDLPLTEIGFVKNLSNAEQEQYRNLALTSGASFTRPVNMDGTRSAMVGFSYGFPWDLVMSNVNLGMNANYSVSPSKLAYYTYNEEKSQFNVINFTSKVKNLSLSPRIFISSNISQDLDFSLSYSPSYSKVTDATNKANNNEYFNQNANARLNWTFWKDFTLEQDLSYSYYGGSSMPNVIDEWIWNMSFGKKILKKNAGEIKLQIYDVLNSRTGYSRSVSNEAITHSYNNFMPRYFLLTFTYKIANYKSSSAIKKKNRGGFGGPGPGGPGGPSFF